MKRRGRKAKNFISSTEETVRGLTRISDGRWKVIGTQIRFTEPDENKAIQRFLELTGQEESLLELAYKRRCNEMVNWKWIGEQILSRPQWVAEKTGVEKLAYYDEAKPPKPLPSFDVLEQEWKDHAACSIDQKAKILRAFQDFKTTAEIGGLRDITPEAVIKYKDAVHARNTSGKQQQHLFCGARRLLRFAKSRAIAVDAIDQALRYMSLLQADKTTVNLNPMPVEVGDFQKLLAEAKGDDRAMILLMLNAALYIRETVRLKRSDFRDGCLVARREKKGKVLRVAPLWKETLEALEAIPKKVDDDHIFFNYAGQPLHRSGATVRFRKLAKRAGVTVLPSQLRDGAFTAAVEANVNEQLCNILVGHRAPGMRDNYVLRSPRMVAPATDAVYRKYFV
jgi:integrase